MLRYSGSTIAAGVVTEVWHFCNRISVLQRNDVYTLQPEKWIFSANKETVLQQDVRKTCHDSV